MDFLTNPFIVIMLFLYRIFANNYVLALVVFTVLVKLVTYPLTAQQMKSSLKMQAVAPKLKKIQEKYKDDREKLAQAQMALYKAEGVNPMAGCFPLIIQMPVLFGLYGAIQHTLTTTQPAIIDLAGRLQVAPDLAQLFPLQNQFLWLNLGTPDPTPILPILVMATTWLQTKLMTPPATDPKDPSAAISRNMLIMMPLMIGFFSVSFASGLSIYWIISNLAGIGQYAFMGRINWRTLSARPMALATPIEDDEPVVTKSKASEQKRIAAPRTASANNGANANNIALSARTPGAGPAPKDRPRITARKRK